VLLSGPDSLIAITRLMHADPGFEARNVARSDLILPAPSIYSQRHLRFYGLSAGPPATPAAGEFAVTVGRALHFHPRLQFRCGGPGSSARRTLMGWSPVEPGLFPHAWDAIAKGQGLHLSRRTACNYSGRDCRRRVSRANSSPMSPCSTKRSSPVSRWTTLTVAAYLWAVVNSTRFRPG